MHGPDAALFVSEGVIEQLAHVGGELFWQLQRGVVIDDRLFDLFGWEVRQITEAVLAGATQEVAVVGAASALGFGVDQTGGASVLVAAVAEDATLQVVLMDAVALPAVAAHVPDVLDAVVEFLADEWVVTTLVDVAFVNDVAQVVRVLEHLVEVLEAHRPLGPAAVAAHGQAHVGHGGFEAFESVVAGGIEFPGLHHQRGALGIECDGVDRLAVVFDADIEVAKFRCADGAPVDRLLAHLGLDVQSLNGVLPAIHDVEHAFHRHRVGAFAEVLLGGYEPDADLFQLTADDGSVEVVAEGTRAHVDDDVVDVAVFHQVAEQFVEHGPILDVLGGGARLDELLDDFSVEAVSLALPEVALGMDGQAVGVDVDGGGELRFRRHAQV